MGMRAVIPRGLRRRRSGGGVGGGSRAVTADRTQARAGTRVLARDLMGVAAGAATRDSVVPGVEQDI
ncbi:MAG: hypothetical protein AAF235_07345 [Planctomycetota bacterium]